MDQVIIFTIGTVYRIMSTSVGDPHQCTAELVELIWADVDCRKGHPCPVDGVVHSKVGPEFYGMSVYFFALDCIKHSLGPEAMPNW